MQPFHAALMNKHGDLGVDLRLIHSRESSVNHTDFQSTEWPQYQLLFRDTFELSKDLNGEG